MIAGREVVMSTMIEALIVGTIVVGVGIFVIYVLDKWD